MDAYKTVGVRIKNPLNLRRASGENQVTKMRECIKH